MAKPLTYLRKDPYTGWGARSFVRRDIQGKKAEVKVVTEKSISRELETCVSVGFVTEDGKGVRHVIGLGTGRGDYLSKWAWSTPKRVTEAVVSKQHDEILQKFEEVLKSIDAYYEEKAKC